MTDNSSANDKTESIQPRSIWVRGLLMLVFVFLFGVAETLMFFSTIFQFLWMLFNKTPNQAIISFGKSLTKWLAKVVQFQTGASEDLPFPWSPWE